MRKNLTTSELKILVADRLRDPNISTEEFTKLLRWDEKLNTRRRKPRDPAAKSAARHREVLAIEAEARSQAALKPKQPDMPKQNQLSESVVAAMMRKSEPEPAFYRSSNTQQHTNPFIPEIFD